MEKLSIKEAIIVEGRYDKNNLSQLVDALIIETNGFALFNNAEKRAFIKNIAQTNGIIILTDSDASGFVIRNYIKSFVDEKYIKNAYIPEIAGKEKRKKSYSKERLIGVEGVSREILYNALIQVTEVRSNNSTNVITMSDLYSLGLVGRPDSSKLRQDFCIKNNIPCHINNKDLLKYINNNEEVQKCLSRNLEKCT